MLCYQIEATAGLIAYLFNGLMTSHLSVAVANIRIPFQYITIYYTEL